MCGGGALNELPAQAHEIDNAALTAQLASSRQELQLGAAARARATPAAGRGEVAAAAAGGGAGAGMTRGPVSDKGSSARVGTPVKVVAPPAAASGGGRTYTPLALQFASPREVRGRGAGECYLTHGRCVPGSGEQ